jgi:hypothetical protein
MHFLARERMLHRAISVAAREENRSALIRRFTPDTGSSFGLHLRQAFAVAQDNTKRPNGFDDRILVVMTHDRGRPCLAEGRSRMAPTRRDRIICSKNPQSCPPGQLARIVGSKNRVSNHVDSGRRWRAYVSSQHGQYPTERARRCDARLPK